MESEEFIKLLDDAAIEVKALSFTKQIEKRDVQFIRTEIVLSILQHLRDGIK